MLTSSLCLCFEAVLGVIAGGLVLLLPETKGRVLPETVEDVENFHRWVTMINLQQFSLAIQKNPCPEGILGVTCLPCWFPRSCWVISRFWLDKFRIAALVSQMSCSTIINGICVKKKPLNNWTEKGKSWQQLCMWCRKRQYLLGSQSKPKGMYMIIFLGQGWAGEELEVIGAPWTASFLVDVHVLLLLQAKCSKGQQNLSPGARNRGSTRMKKV